MDTLMQQPNLLKHRGHWIFDLDGTLTVSAHDFDHIRRELGLAPETLVFSPIWVHGNL
jgi:hypothetical protein